MSQLTAGDEALHYSDSSHRWIAPPDIAQDVWEAGMRAHMEVHRAGGRPAPEVERSQPRRLRVA